MTRDEAVEKLKAVKIGDDYTFKQQISSHGFVDGLAALGLLKLDKPKTPTEQLCTALNWGEASSKIFTDTLAETGLKVVRA